MMCAVGKSRLRAGFTLLELLMVVVIIGMLIGFLMPVVGSMKLSALKRRHDAEADLIRSAIVNYHAENGKWWPETAQPDEQWQGRGVFTKNNAGLINALWQNSPPLLDTNNMVLNVNGYYQNPTNPTIPWKITIATSNRTVTVE